MNHSAHPTAIDISATVDIAELKRTFGTFVTGVTVVTTIDASGSPRGLTANSFTSVSLDPPLVLFCIAKTSSNYSAFRDAESVAINILAEDQNVVASQFAKRVEDRFAGIGWHAGHTGSPILAGAAAWLDCTRHDVVEMGDHIIVVARVESFGRNIQMRPLAYAQGNFISLSLLELEAQQRFSSKTRVAAIAETNGRIALFRMGERWGLKFESVSEALSHAESINLPFIAYGSRVQTAFLYSVYSTPDRRETHLLYRGELTEGANAAEDDLRLFGEQDVPWDHIDRFETLSALRRYFAERKQGRFGIYVHDDSGGQVSFLTSRPTPWTAPEPA